MSIATPDADTAATPTVSALIESGHLRLVEASECRRFGFRHRVVIADDVWRSTVHWDDEIEEQKNGYTAQETEARLRDLLWWAIRAAKGASSRTAHFAMRRVPPEGGGTQAKEITLAMTIGPGDDGRGLISIYDPSVGVAR